MKRNGDLRSRMPGGHSAEQLDRKIDSNSVRTLTCIFLTIWLVVVVSTSLLAAQTPSPMETLKVNVDKVMAVLKDPALQGEAAVNEKKEALRKISNEMFNWPLLSKLVLSRNWKIMTPDQQQEFIPLFKDILEKAYADRILAYKDGTVEYVSNQMLTENKAEVETKVVSASSSAPITLTYRLALMDGKWGVYDVIVEGVSLTKNYRDQFRDFLADKTPAQLLEHLKEMVGE